jgi:hypothetical protein
VHLRFKCSKLTIFAQTLAVLAPLSFATWVVFGPCQCTLESASFCLLWPSTPSEARAFIVFSALGPYGLSFAAIVAAFSNTHTATLSGASLFFKESNCCKNDKLLLVCCAHTCRLCHSDQVKKQQLRTGYSNTSQIRGCRKTRGQSGHRCVYTSAWLCAL